MPRRVSKYLENFVSLLDEPVLVVDNKLNILHSNDQGSEFLEKSGDLRVGNLKDLQCFSKLMGNQEFTLEDGVISLNYDKESQITIKPLRAKSNYLVVLKSESKPAPIDTSMHQNLSHIVHDMRTPLTAMIGFTRLLTDPGLDEAERKEFLERAEKNLEYIESIINNILHFSKQESNSIVVVRKITDSRIFIEGLIADLTQIVKPTGLSFEYSISDSIPQHIALDTKGVRHVLENLISNAVKYTNAGCVSIDITCHAAGSELRVRVRDTGIGIKKDHQDKIFEPFYQEHHVDQGGVGLGLSIIKLYSHALGGDVKLIESTPGKGSCFEASFDCSINGDLSEASLLTLSDDTKEHHHLSLANKKILIVDDSRDIRLILGKVLQKCGAEVISCEHPSKALDYLAIGDIDLLISDMQMPGMNGHELLDEARSSGYTGPAIALSGLDAETSMTQSGQNHFYCYLTKPLSFDALKAMIAEILESPTSFNPKSG